MVATPDFNNNPAQSRPYMPGYGVPPQHEGKGLLPWEWAVEHLTTARNYWIATARPGVVLA